EDGKGRGEPRGGEVAERVVLEVQPVARGLLPELRMIQGLGAPGGHPLVPGQVGRHASGPRRVEAKGPPVEGETSRRASAGARLGSRSEGASPGREIRATSRTGHAPILLPDPGLEGPSSRETTLAGAAAAPRAAVTARIAR